MDYTAPPPLVSFAEVAEPQVFTPDRSPSGYVSYAIPEYVPPTERPKYNFTYTWFDNNLSNWQELTAPFRGRANQILEVGSFEGGSTTWLLDNLMDDPTSTLTAIDTFGGGNESAPSDYDVTGLEERFWYNVQQAKNSSKLRQMKGQSPDSLIQLRNEGAQFDFIYIDGSHVAADVLQDAVLAWPMLREGGVMAFDDYNWYFYEQEYYNPHIAIASFLSCIAPSVRWIERNGQIWATKIKNTTPPKPR